MLAALILFSHLLVIAFNLFGLAAVPLGAWRHWRFVHIAGWRLAHLASLGVTALQAALGRACFLTTWQASSEDRAGTEPLIMHWVNATIYWPLPGWLFTLIYLLVFAYAVALLRIVPLRWR
jgi:hypothetical protein